ncbi:helix-turn-helix domain-containing protein [Desulfomonile tiedjei]|uniref:Helix-turn-helix domain-containing protein n=1 Tax=Desulfomonile tiedjei (strain ATCC 49306 / DSM 6799 / DCB-1) TaxID=706587 RepID=I4C604_DESTA|nr:helix-turn-helix domain-containing protein [Desulfomonile tiedjei]AFM24995.1 hypothetical protein Desti_2307 [Desulfomonile tiedjei DSM 6799]
MPRKNGAGRDDRDLRREDERNQSTTSPSTQPFQLLTPAQVAGMLQIPVKSVHALCRAGKLGYIRIDGKSRRFTLEDVETFLNERRVSGQSARVTAKSGLSSHVRNHPVDRSPKPSVVSSKGGKQQESGKAFRASLRREMQAWE